MAWLLASLKYYKYGLVALALLIFTYLFIANKTLKENLEIQQLHSELAAKELYQAKIKIGEQDYTIARLSQDMEMARTEHQILQARLAEARQIKSSVTRAIYDHDLKNLAQAKPGLVTNRMQSATDKLWLDFEAAAKP